METKPTTQLIVTLIGLPILIISLVLGVFLLAGRGLSEPMGYLSAASDETADRLTESLPQEVRDKKLDRDLEAIRQNLIDRKVQLQLSQRRIAELERDVAELTKRVDRRKRLLGEAYPILQKAVEQDAQTVRFASESFTLDEFQREIDELLVAQEADEQRLSVKRGAGRSGPDAAEAGAGRAGG